MDVCVTVPKALWEIWLDEGNLPGDAWNGSEYHFFGRGGRPKIEAGEHVYIVAHGRLRGYAPLVAIDCRVTGRRRDTASLCRLALDEQGVFGITAWHPLPLPEWWWPGATYGLVRHGGAVACTIPEPVRGFPGWRYRFWQREDEMPFPNWQSAGVA